MNSTDHKIQMLPDGTFTVPNIVAVPFITGDGIGTEITPAMQQVIDQAIKTAYNGQRQILWTEVPAGQHAFDTLGTYLPDDTLKAFADYHIGIKGPLTTPVGGGIRSLNVAMRQGLDLYVCLRPVRWFKGVESPVKHPERVNMVVFRENTEDIYAGIEWKATSAEARRFYEFLHDEMGVTKVRFPETSAFGVKPVSEEGSKRLIKAACQYALQQGSKHVTLVHKGNIMKFTEGGFKNWGYELAEQEFKNQIRMDDCICDAFLQNALIKPEAYDVIATMNLNGDYVSDMLAAQVGGIGISPGANINYEAGRAIFEATHGTAPDLVGKNQANPCSIILSAVMMLDHVGWHEASEKVTKAIESAFVQGFATADLARFMENGKPLGTKEFAAALCQEMA